MEPSPDAPVPVLQREVERPGQGGHGLLPVLILAAAMMSTLAAAALAMTITPRAQHCPRSGRSLAPALAPAASFARPAAPAMPAPRAIHAVVAPAPDPACAPRVYRGQGDVQEWTFETCASAPMPRHFAVR